MIWDAQWLGRVRYDRAHALQAARRDDLLADRTRPDVLLLLEHPAVVTVGRRAIEPTPDVAALAARGVDFARTERGGLATVHAPGQLVAWLIVDLWRAGIGVRHLVDAIETGAARFLADLGVEAHPWRENPGLYVAHGAGRAKIAAIGLHVQRGVSMHGLAVNLDPDLSLFDLVVPCGLVGVPTTSVAQLRGAAPGPAQCWSALAAHLRRAVDDRRRQDKSAEPTGT